MTNRARCSQGPWELHLALRFWRLSHVWIDLLPDGLDLLDAEAQLPAHLVQLGSLPAGQAPIGHGDRDTGPKQSLSLLGR